MCYYDINYGEYDHFKELLINKRIVEWNEDQIKLSEILSIIDYKPLYGNKRAKTHWLVFMKVSEENDSKNRSMDA
ncbi:predicted protein [Enterococcus faecalis T8]|nr:predicted protein [Enterococcus faecalis T8]